ncbi:IS110 family transposase [Actinomadura darangshiensis]
MEVRWQGLPCTADRHVRHGGGRTHADVHVAVALDQTGGKLAVISVATTPAGYRELLRWARDLGEVGRFGLAGTGSYGSGPTRLLRRHQGDVVEVIRPSRRNRRLTGKNDALDAEAAARAVLPGPCCPGPSWASPAPGRQGRDGPDRAGLASFGD